MNAHAPRHVPKSSAQPYRPVAINQDASNRRARDTRAGDTTAGRAVVRYHAKTKVEPSTRRRKQQTSKRTAINRTTRRRGTDAVEPRASQNPKIRRPRVRAKKLRSSPSQSLTARTVKALPAKPRSAPVGAAAAQTKKTNQTPPAFEPTGWARWMGPSWKGHVTKSGEIFDPARLTAAHETLPIPSFLYVTNRANGRTVLVRINDRAPGSKGRAVIVSEMAANLLGFREAGRTRVDLQYAGPAAKRPNQKHEQAFLRHQPWFRLDMLRTNQPKRTQEAKPKTQITRRYPKPSYPRWDQTTRTR